MQSQCRIIYLLSIILLMPCFEWSMVPVHIDRFTSSQLSQQAIKSLSSVSTICKKMNTHSNLIAADCGLTDQQIEYIDRHLVKESSHSYETLRMSIHKHLVPTFESCLPVKHVLQSLKIHDHNIDKMINTELVFAALLHPEQLFALNTHDYQMVKNQLLDPEYQDSSKIHSQNFGLHTVYESLPISSQRVQEYDPRLPIVDIHEEYVDLCSAKQPTMISALKDKVIQAIDQVRDKSGMRTQEIIDRRQPPLVRIPTKGKALDARFHKKTRTIAVLQKDAVIIYTPDGTDEVARCALQHQAQWLSWISESIVAVVGNDFFVLWNYTNGAHMTASCSQHLRFTVAGNSLLFMHDEQLYCVDLESFTSTHFSVNQPDYARMEMHADNHLLCVGETLLDLQQARQICTLGDSASSDINNHIPLVRHCGFTADGSAFFYVKRNNTHEHMLVRYGRDTMHKTDLMRISTYASWAFSSHGFFACFDATGMRMYRITADDMQLISHPAHDNYELERVGAYFDDHQPWLYSWNLTEKYWKKWDFSDACAIADAWQQVNAIQKWVVYAVMKNPQGLVLTRDVLNLLLTLPPVIQKAVTQQFYRSSLISWAVLRAAQKFKGL